MSKKVPVSEVDKLMKYWDENNELDPHNVNSYSTKKVFWNCPKCGYRWKSSVYTRMTSRSGCPACNHHVATKDYNALTEYPELRRFFDTEVADNPKLENLLPASRKTIFWKCPDCGYKWDQPLHQRIRRYKGEHRIADCPVCAGNAVKGINTDFYPAIAAEWDIEKNGKNCDGIKTASTATYWWKCKLGHSYKMSVKDRVNDYENGRESCPYCDDRRTMPGQNSLKALYPQLMQEWDAVSNSVLIDPDKRSPGSKDDAWWNCPKGHTYRMRISHRVMFDYRGIEACPICKGLTKKRIHLHKKK